MRIKTYELFKGDSSKMGEVLRKEWFETHVSRAEPNPDDTRDSIPPGDGRGAGNNGFSPKV